MSSTSIYNPTTTSRISSYQSPSNAFIISAVLIGIIVLILIYFCISDKSRYIMIIGFYWFCFLLVKIILFVPALLVLLYCYIYKFIVFICKKIKNKSRIDVELHDTVDINNTYVSTDSSTDASTDSSTDSSADSITNTIEFILNHYSCSICICPFSGNIPY